MIYRPASNKQDHYTKLPNMLLRGGTSASISRNDELSPEALGVLVYLLSHVDDWQITNRQLCTVFNVGAAKITAITKKLELAGYIKRIQPRSRTGEFAKWDWLVTDERWIFPPDSGLPDVVSPDVDLPASDNREQRRTIETITITKEETSWKQALLNSCPSESPRGAWQEWWEYKLSKRGKRKPAERMIREHTEDFKIMKRHGFDISGVVGYAISRGWERIGKPDWQALNCFKGNDRRNDLLGAVK